MQRKSVCCNKPEFRCLKKGQKHDVGRYFTCVWKAKNYFKCLLSILLDDSNCAVEINLRDLKIIIRKQGPGVLVQI